MHIRIVNTFFRINELFRINWSCCYKVENKPRRKGHKKKKDDEKNSIYIMLKTRLNFKKVIAITICFAGFSISDVLAQDPTTDPGVIINGIKWATRNVGEPNKFVNNPTDDGMFYQWDTKVGWSARDPLVSSPAGKFWSHTNPSGNPVWMPGNNPCPAGWRLPTPAELESLADAGSEYKWLTRTWGREFGSGSNTIFLPAQGHRYWSNGSLNYTTRGYYWSNTNTLGNGGNPYALSFTSTGVTPDNRANPSYGFCVRCVAENFTGIHDIFVDTETVAVKAYYDILGRKLNEEPTKGIYIILYHNGKTKKMMK